MKVFNINRTLKYEYLPIKQRKHIPSLMKLLLFIINEAQRCKKIYQNYIEMFVKAKEKRKRYFLSDIKEKSVNIIRRKAKEITKF